MVQLLRPSDCGDCGDNVAINKHWVLTNATAINNVAVIDNAVGAQQLP